MNTKCRTCRIAAAAVLILMISNAVADKYLVIPTASSTATTCDGPDEVISGDGRCWMNRNLGAIQVATTPTDSAAYGDLYQWGRRGEGHQNRTSPTTTVRSGYDVSWYRAFIKATAPSGDWRNPQNHKLWQGLSGINNPCPQGFRIPTIAEWATEVASWDSEDAEGAFASPLKLVLSGFRFHSDASLQSVDLFGLYWSSTVDESDSLYLLIGSSVIDLYSPRADGMSVRCIKD